MISQQYTCHTVLLMKMPSLKWIHKILWQSGHIFYKKDNEQDNYPGVTQYIFTVRHVMQCTLHSMAVGILSVHLSIRHLYCDKTK